MSRIAELAKDLYDAYGQRKSMATSTPPPNEPHYFLVRTFLAENDLLVIFNTQRCRYQCHFCQLPAKSTRSPIPPSDIVSQFEGVIVEVKHCLSVLDRITLSNEGSVLDTATFSADALDEIVGAIGQLKRVRTVVLETRLEFVQPGRMAEIKTLAQSMTLDILTGFETVDQYIRDQVLGKRESLDVFLAGLDNVAQSGSRLTAYVLFKPSPTMTDQNAIQEANGTIVYLVDECHRRGVDLTIRLNPMYLARGSLWARRALEFSNYQPPRLTDIMRLAEIWRTRGLRIYIGLSTEGLADPSGTYQARSDYDPRLIRMVKMFNDNRIGRFSLDG